jgi:hypothetical protein
MSTASRRAARLRSIVVDNSGLSRADQIQFLRANQTWADDLLDYSYLHRLPDLAETVFVILELNLRCSG